MVFVQSIPYDVVLADSSYGLRRTGCNSPTRNWNWNGSMLICVLRAGKLKWTDEISDEDGVVLPCLGANAPIRNFARCFEISDARG